jgi:hypothetical protein
MIHMATLTIITPNMATTGIMTLGTTGMEGIID